MITRRQSRASALSFVAGFMLLFASGCMSYRTGGLSSAGFDKKQFHSTPTLTAFIDLKCLTQTVLETVPRENVAMSQQLRKVIAGVLNESAAFKSYTFSAYGATNADLRIVLTITQREDGFLPMAVISGASLCVIPLTWSENYSLAAEVMDSEKQQKAHYEVADSMRNWVQILLLPFSFSCSPGKVQEQLIGSMICIILTRMNADNLLHNTK
jgi:hypothetical protein